MKANEAIHQLLYFLKSSPDGLCYSAGCYVAMTTTVMAACQ
jgi:hypothetical protein